MFLDRSAIQHIHRCSFCARDLLCKDIHNVRKCKQLLKVRISCLNLAVYMHGFGTHDIFPSGGSGVGRPQDHISPPVQNSFHFYAGFGKNVAKKIG